MYVSTYLISLELQTSVKNNRTTCADPSRHGVPLQAVSLASRVYVEHTFPPFPPLQSARIIQTTGPY